MSRFFAILKDLAGVAPAEFQVLPEGKTEIEGLDPVYIDEAAAQTVIARFKRRGNDMVIDYEHQTLENTQAPAAGWVKDLVWKGSQGLWAVGASWTQRAKGYLTNLEYRYFSPVIAVGADGRVEALINIALTNSPRINHLQPIVAKYCAAEARTEKEANMFEKLKKLFGLAENAGEDKILEAATLLVAKAGAGAAVACKEILDVLGAKADAGKDEVVRICATLKTGGVVACKEVLDALGVKADTGKDEVLRIVAALKAPADVAVALSQEVAVLKSKIATMEQQDLVALALKEGKTSPEELDKWGRDLALKNPDSFKTIVCSRPVGSVIPVTEIVVLKDQPSAVSTDVQQQVNRMMGIPEETFKKYNK